MQMTKSKNVQLRYLGYMEHYERAAHVQEDGSVDRPPTLAEKFACTERIVDDLHTRGIDQESVTFKFANNFTNTISREAANWLIDNEVGEWEIVGEEEPAEQAQDGNLNEEG